MENSIRVVPFSELTQEELERHFSQRMNWVVEGLDGEVITRWARGVDPTYGAFEHVAIINDEKGTAFDKVNFTGLGVFALIYRENPETDSIEFLLPRERRPLLRDEGGIQGNVEIINMVQGNIKSLDGETFEDAARREIKEETGQEPEELILMRRVYWDAANSESAHPVFLARVSNAKVYNQQLSDTEKISVGERNWMTLDQIIEAEEIQCGKTLASLMLATGYLGLLNKK